MATVYVTLQITKEHLRITDTDHDSDVTRKMEQAEALIVDWLVGGRTRYEDPTLPNPDTPGGLIIQSAILDLVAGLYEHRGDDYGGFGGNDADARLWDAIIRKLRRLRDPVIA